MTVISETSLKLELGLAVSDLGAAIQFYTTLLAAAPVRRIDDFARFEVDDPPLVLTLRAGASQAGGALNHIGYRLEEADELIEIQHRLESAGISTQREDGVECCYTLQTKFWVSDPDKNVWEIYSLDDEEDDEHAAEITETSSTIKGDMPIVWGHRSGEPWPERLPFSDGEADEIYLHGTFDDDLDDSNQRQRLGEVLRVLKPGGTLGLELLASIHELPGHISSLANAGFLAVRVDQMSPPDEEPKSKVWRIQLSAIKPDLSGTATRFEVMYRGPAQQVELASGQYFRRGERGPVDRATWNLFGTNDDSAAFTCFPTADE